MCMQSSAIMEKAVLVIKHGALGDMILASSAFAAIRKAHCGLPIILMTNQAYVALAEKMPYFDHIWVDDRPKWWRFKAWYVIWCQLCGRWGAGYHFERIYDLQCSGRTTWYHRLLSVSTTRQPPWFGAAPGCMYPRPFAPGSHHVLSGFVRHFAKYGMQVAPYPDVSWLHADVSALSLPANYVVLICGCSPKHARKRWTAQGFAGVIQALTARGITSVVTGAGQDAKGLVEIKQYLQPGVLLMDLIDRSSLDVMATLGRGALAVLGLDTGPTHLVAATGAPTLVLFSSFKSPALCAPRGPKVTILEKPVLADLRTEEVVEALTDQLSDADWTATR